MDTYKTKGEDNYQCREVKAERDELKRQINEQAAMIERLLNAINKAHKELDDEPDSPHLCDRIFHALDSVASQKPAQHLTAHDNAVRAEVAGEMAQAIKNISCTNNLGEERMISRDEARGVIDDIARKYKGEG